MKQDPYFKFVAAALIAAVVLAFASPSATAKPKKIHASTLSPAAAISAKS